MFGEDETIWLLCVPGAGEGLELLTGGENHVYQNLRYFLPSAITQRPNERTSLKGVWLEHVPSNKDRPGQVGGQNVIYLTDNE
eukprot:gene19620-6802_t